MERGDVCGRVVWDSKCKVGRYPFIRKKVTTFAKKRVWRWRRILSADRKSLDRESKISRPFQIAQEPDSEGKNVLENILEIFLEVQF